MTTRFGAPDSKLLLKPKDFSTHSMVITVLLFHQDDLAINLQMENVLFTTQLKQPTEKLLMISRNAKKIVATWLWYLSQRAWCWSDMSVWTTRDLVTVTKHGVSPRDVPQEPNRESGPPNEATDSPMNEYEPLYKHFIRVQELSKRLEQAGEHLLEPLLDAKVV